MQHPCPTDTEIPAVLNLNVPEAREEKQLV